MVLSALIDDNQWNKCHSLLWFSLMEPGIKKVSMELCAFTSLVLVLKNVFVPLNSASVRMEYNQLLQSSFGVKGRGVADFHKQAY